MQLNSRQSAIHNRAVTLSRNHREVERQIIEVLQEVEASRVHKAMGKSSLFMYAVDCLNLTESVAYAFVAVSRKCKEISPLHEAIGQQELSVAKASRLVSGITCENAAELIEFAKTNSSKKVDQELARRNPKAPKPPRAKPVSGDRVELRVELPREVYEMLLRANTVTKNGSVGLAGVFEAALGEYLDRHDPVRKAERALERQARKEQQNETTNQDKSENFRDLKVHEGSGKRVPLKAHEKHAAIAKSQGQCTVVDENGKRCPSDRYLETHHIEYVSRGGTNDPENLTVLCSFHHDLIHSSSIREPSVRYSA